MFIKKLSLIIFTKRNFKEYFYLTSICKILRNFKRVNAITLTLWCQTSSKTLNRSPMSEPAFISIVSPSPWHRHRIRTSFWMIFIHRFHFMFYLPNVKIVHLINLLAVSLHSDSIDETDLFAQIILEFSAIYLVFLLLLIVLIYSYLNLLIVYMK